MNFERHIPIPMEFQYTDDYWRSEKPMKSVTKYVINLRKSLREFVLSGASPEQIQVSKDEYFAKLKDVYHVEADMHEVSRMFAEEINIRVGVSALYHFISRTKMLWNLPREAIHNGRLPFSRVDMMEPEWFNSWWNLVFVILDEDPRETLKDTIEFKEISGGTKMKIINHLGEKELKGMEILRRESEIFSGDEDEGGVVLLYVWVKDNPSDRLPTKTVFCFSVDEKMESIRVYPIILNVDR